MSVYLITQGLGETVLLNYESIQKSMKCKHNQPVNTSPCFRRNGMESWDVSVRQCSSRSIILPA